MKDITMNFPVGQTSVFDYMPPQGGGKNGYPDGFSSADEQEAPPDKRAMVSR